MASLLLSSIIKQFEASLRSQYGSRLLPSHYKALAAMKHCRSAQSPVMLARCSQCEQHRYLPHSCGHRNCPHCQHHESQRWIERQCQKLVSGDYYMLTFTLPSEFRALAWQAQRKVYSSMLKCSWDTAQTFSQNDSKLRGTPGAAAVLHTHSRRLDYHPHVHLVMPAAALDAKHRLWRTKGRSNTGRPYLFNHKALAKMFRGKMLDTLVKLGLVLPASYPRAWVVDCQHVGQGDKVLIYLGRYLYRGVIAEKDIKACNNGKVTFRYQNARAKQAQYRSIDGAKFLWLLLKHVLPRGFRRARNYGFMHPNSKRLLELLQYLLKLNPNRVLAVMKKRTKIVCTSCGAGMKIIQTNLLPGAQIVSLAPT